MEFCVRDDDTSFFTSPHDLENAYVGIFGQGPVSLAVVPFQKGSRTKGIPEAYWRTDEIYPLGDNPELVSYLRYLTQAGHIEIMLHGSTHADQNGLPEFAIDDSFTQRVADGKKYLEQLLGIVVRVFVPPHNSISSQGLQAVRAAGLHLGCMANPLVAWPKTSWRTWTQALRYYLQLKSTGFSPHWVLDLGDHHEIVGHAVTPSAEHATNLRKMTLARQRNGVFCIATHYWEFDTPARQPHGLTVRQQLAELIVAAQADPDLQWRTVGDILS